MLMGDKVEPRREFIEKNAKEVRFLDVARQATRQTRWQTAQTLEGKIEPIELEDEMRSSFIDYAMSVIVDRALPDVRDGLKPTQRRILVAMNDLGLAPNKQHRKCAKIAGDTSGNYHPHGEAVDLPDPRAHGAGLQHALPAGRRPGQLRLGRRRPAGGDAVHRGPLSAASPSRCCATSTPTPSTSCPTTTRRGASPPCCPAASRTCWSTARPASPSAWRPTSRRTTWARSSTPIVARHRQSGRDAPTT